MQALMCAANSQNEVLRKVYQIEDVIELKPNFENGLTSSIEIIIQGLKQLD